MASNKFSRNMDNETVEKINKQLKKEQIPSNKLKLKDWVKAFKLLGTGKAGYLFQIGRLMLFIVIVLALFYAIFKFGGTVKHTLFEGNSKEYSVEFIQEVQLELENSKALNLSTEQTQIIEKILIEEAEKVVKLKSNNSDLENLKIIEHLFIYLLPFLVALGLYYYFEANFKTRLISDSKPNQTDIQIAEKSLNTTKTLFLSSMMAYVIIKIIEKVFFYEKLELLNIVTYCVLLIILMGYILMSHKNHE